MKQKIIIGIMAAGIVIGIIGILLGAQYLWAKIVYHDAHCMFAQCRINIQK
jgi:hypothetical protein